MSEYHVVIRRDDGYEVWLDTATDPEPATNSIVIGSSPTRDGALRAAQEELTAALERVTAALKLDFEVLP